MEMALNNMRQRKGTPPEVEIPGPEGDAVRARVGKEAYDLNVNQYCCGGLNFGYFYAQSPIIAYDGGEHPTYTMSDFTPSTVPGCRPRPATSCSSCSRPRSRSAPCPPAAASWQ